MPRTAPPWTTVAQKRGNTAGVATHDLPGPVSARYVRLLIITPTQTADTAARIYELEVYAWPMSARGTESLHAKLETVTPAYWHEDFTLRCVIEA